MRESWVNLSWSVDHVGDGDGLLYRDSLVEDKGIDPVILDRQWQFDNEVRHFKIP